MSETEWVQHWQDRLVGLALSGLVLDTDERPKGPATAGLHALTIPAKVQKLLAQMYRSMKPPAPVQNGAAAPTQRPVAAS